MCLAVNGKGCARNRFMIGSQAWMEIDNLHNPHLKDGRRISWAQPFNCNYNIVLGSLLVCGRFVNIPACSGEGRVAGNLNDILGIFFPHSLVNH